MRFINRIILVLIAINTSLHAIDNPHFYRATNTIWQEPRIEHTNLSSFDATIGGGSTHHGYNSCHHTVPLFDIYGSINAGALILNTGTDRPENPYAPLLNKLATLSGPDTFAHLSAHGAFSIIESNLSFCHNFGRGCIFFFHLPIRKPSINHPSFIDLSPDGDSFRSKTNPTWQQFLHSFDAIMNHYNVNTKATNQAGIGDCTTLIGWTHNYQDTKTLDFIDGTITTGFLAPTGKKKDHNHLFSLPLGYNGHWGFPINIMLSFGMYEWVTLGAYAHAIFFLKNNQCVRIQTASEQSGIIKLAHDHVTVKHGPVWNTGVYLKADHFMYGLSFCATYSYAGQAKNKLYLSPNSPFNNHIANNDPELKGWQMHTLQLNAEYDFAKQNSKIGPRLGIFYNCQLRGIRTFKTNMVGGTVGLDVGWDL